MEGAEGVDDPAQKGAESGPRQVVREEVEGPRAEPEVSDSKHVEGGLQTDNWDPGIKFVCADGDKPSETKLEPGKNKGSDMLVYEQLAACAQGEQVEVNGTNSDQMFALHEVMQMVFLSSHERREVGPGDLDHQAPIFIAP